MPSEPPPGSKSTITGTGQPHSERNQSDQLVVAANISLFADIIKRTGPLTSICELGANVGLNVQALKHDFAGEFMDRHPDFELVDYGFRYHRGPFAQDDCTWFLMRRAAS